MASQRLVLDCSDIDIKDSSCRPPNEGTMANLDEASYPLPRNFGLGNSVPYFIDNEMVSALCATERTTPQFQSLLEHAGLKLVAVYRTRGLHSVFEAVLARP